MNARHHKTMLPIAIGAAFLLAAVAACFQVSSDEVPTAEPCIPLAGSGVDPCEREPEWSVPSNTSGSYRIEDMPRIPYRLIDEDRRLAYFDGSYGVLTPQFYIRGTFVPGSSRCERARASLFLDEDGLTVYDYDKDPPTYIKHQCFIDVRVHEYFNGEGPDRVPIFVATRYASPAEVDDEYASRIADDTPMSWMEGREMVFSLARPLDLSVGAWDLISFLSLWDVQQRGDGEVVVVGGWAHLDSRFDYEFTLDDFRGQVKVAMSTFVEETGGRVGIDRNSRMMAQDANLGSLMENLRLYGAYSVADITPVAAPLVPGETDPDPYGLLAKAH